MAFCLNPDCPHRKEMGYPAEFREGITHCSDCGSLLSEEAIEKEDARKTSPKITLTDLHKRILYTIGFVLLYRVLLFIPAPGIDLQVLGSFFSDEQLNRLLRFLGSEPALERFSILALGIMPYISAYIIVEILSLFIPPLKSWRQGGYAGRIRIKEMALFATFLIALVQGYGITVGLEHMMGAAGEKIIRHPGLGFRLVMVLTLTTGTFLTIWIAELITRKGIGHGISVLIFVGFGPRVFSNILQIKWVSYEHGPVEYFLLFAIIVIALMAFIVLMEKSYRKIPVRFSDGVDAYIPLKLTPAGIIPASGGEFLIGIPITILGFTGMMGYKVSQKLSEALVYGSIWYYIAHAIIIFFFYYFFVSFFYDPKEMIAVLKNKRASIVSPPGEKDEHYIDKSLESIFPLGALYLIFIVFIPTIAFRFLPLILGGTVLITAGAIILDLIDEVHIRGQGGNLLKVAELHDVPMAGLVKSLLAQKGLPCYLRGYYHRALLYFFGPYIEISVLVPEEKIADAREVIENYFKANILTVQSSKVSGV
jgi:preprotein translocase subunit SecY